MTNNKNFLNIFLLIILLISLFSFSWSIKADSLTKRKVKGRIGTHWYRIGKRFELEPEEEPESLSTNKNICDDLLMLANFPFKSDLGMMLEQQYV